MYGLSLSSSSYPSVVVVDNHYPRIYTTFDTVKLCDQTGECWSDTVFNWFSFFSATVYEFIKTSGTRKVGDGAKGERTMADE